LETAQSILRVVRESGAGAKIKPAQTVCSEEFNGARKNPERCAQVVTSVAISAEMIIAYTFPNKPPGHSHGPSFMNGPQHHGAGHFCLGRKSGIGKAGDAPYVVAGNQICVKTYPLVDRFRHVTRGDGNSRQRLARIAAMVCVDKGFRRSRKINNEMFFERYNQIFKRALQTLFRVIAEGVRNENKTYAVFTEVFEVIGKLRPILAGEERIATHRVAVP